MAQPRRFFLSHFAGFFSFFFLATSAARSSFCSCRYSPRRFMYSSFSFLPRTILLRVAALKARLRWTLAGVIRRWILGALEHLSVWRRTTNLRTSSFLSGPKSLRILLARFGPRRRGL